MSAIAMETTSSLDKLNVLGFLLITLSVIAVSLYAQWSFKRRRMLKISSRIPFPKNRSYYPIIGHGHHFIGDTETTLNKLLEFASTSIYPQTAHLGHLVFHSIIRPEDIEIVLNSRKTLEKDNLYRFTVAMAGKGLFNLDVKTWRKHRKLITPTLNPKILESFVPIFAEQCAIMMDLLEEQVGKKFDIQEFVSRCSLDCVLETSMGVQFNCQTADINKIEEKINRGMDILMLRVYNVLYHFDFIYNLTSMAKEEKQIVHSFKSFIDKIVLERKRDYMRKKTLAEEQPEAEVLEKKKRNFFLDHLMELSVEENKFTNEEMTDEVRTYVIAASDTSATVAAFSMTCIAMFPDVQQKVYEEVMDVVGGSRDIELADLPRLKYTEMVIKEVMRLFPVGPIFLRKVEDDLELETCTLAKGVGLVICIMLLHRHPLYYKDPLKFIPERFTPEETAKRHPYAYLPFSAGPRNCIGPKYGMMLTKCMVASIVRKFVLSTEYKSIEEIRFKQSVVIKPVLGFKVSLALRKD